MSSGDIIAIAAIVVPIAVLLFGGLVSSKNKEIALLRAKNDAQSVLIAKLELDNAKLEITGTLINRFFNQLPASNEIKREIQP